MILKELKEKIQIFKAEALKASKILVVAHESPDGDAIGSSLALRIALKALDKEVDVVIMDPVPDSFSYLPYFFKIKGSFLPQDFDMAIIVDCGGWSRTGFFEDDELRIDWPQSLVVIDHHHKQNLSPGIHIIDPQVSSSAQLVFYIFKEWNIKISRNAATCLMTGLSTDTGSFKHSNTTAEVFKIAGELMGRGANLSKITQNIYLGKSIPRLRLWGRTLDKIRRDRELGLVFSVITQKDLEECGADVSDLEGVINLMNTVPGTKATLLLSEHEVEFKGSLRTEDPKVDVSRLAAIFGGGGHIKAAGFNIPKDNQIEEQTESV